jgi:inner membrane transporter RhtA
MSRGTGYFGASAVFHYLGPSFAVLLFARVDVLGVAWLRIAAAALVFALWRRPWRSLSRPVVALGVVLAVMNVSFYEAIDRLPLATVAAIEFLGPVLLALVGIRSLRNAVAVAVAVGGVYLLTQVQLGGQPLGLGFAFANAALFAAYITLAHRVSRLPSAGGVDGLAAAMLVAFVVVFPVGLTSAAHAVADPVALAAGIGVGVCSSVVPYVLDQLAMVRLPRSTYALMVALLPALAAVIGAVVLAQLPSAADLAGIALVMAAVALHRPDGRPPEDVVGAVGHGDPIARHAGPGGSGAARRVEALHPGRVAEPVAGGRDRLEQQPRNAPGRPRHGGHARRLDGAAVVELPDRAAGREVQEVGADRLRLAVRLGERRFGVGEEPGSGRLARVLLDAGGVNVQEGTARRVVRPWVERVSRRRGGRRGDSKAGQGHEDGAKQIHQNSSPLDRAPAPGASRRGDTVAVASRLTRR